MQGTEVPNLSNQSKQEGACCANILSHDGASHRNFSRDGRSERGRGNSVSSFHNPAPG